MFEFLPFTNIVACLIVPFVDVASNTTSGDNILANLLQTFCEAFCQGSPLASTFSKLKKKKNICNINIIGMNINSMLNYLAQQLFKNHYFQIWKKLDFQKMYVVV